MINMVEDILDKKAVKEAEIHNNKHKKTYTHEEMMGMFGLSIDA